MEVSSFNRECLGWAPSLLQGLKATPVCSVLGPVSYPDHASTLDTVSVIGALLGLWPTESSPAAHAYCSAHVVQAKVTTVLQQEHIIYLRTLVCSDALGSLHCQHYRIPPRQ